MVPNLLSDLVSCCYEHQIDFSPSENGEKEQIKSELEEKVAIAQEQEQERKENETSAVTTTTATTGNENKNDDVDMTSDNNTNENKNDNSASNTSNKRLADSQRGPLPNAKRKKTKISPSNWFLPVLPIPTQYGDEVFKEASRLITQSIHNGATIGVGRIFHEFGITITLINLIQKVCP